MKQCKKEVEIELEDGTTVEGVLTVTEFLDDEFNSEFSDKPQSLVGSWSITHDEELDEDQQQEFDDKIEEIVFSEKWDFDNAPDIDEDEEEALSSEDQEN